MIHDPIRIGLLLPHPIMREGTAMVLRMLEWQVRTEFPGGVEEMNHFLSHTNPDAIIIDPMLITHRVKELHAWKRKYPSVCFIGMVTHLYDPNFLRNFDEILQFTDPVENFAELLRRISVRRSQPKTDSGQDILTERETDVLKLIVEGLSQKEIADRLNISIHTVISHRKNITQKTGIRTQAGLTIYAITNRIIHITDQNPG